MKQKDKNKINPFTELLTPGEEILWLYAAESLSPGQYLTKLLRLHHYRASQLRLLVGCGLFIPIALVKLRLLSFNTGLQLMGTMLAIAFVLALIVYAVMRLQENPTHYTYALTTQRLISMESGMPEALPVASIKSLYIKGTSDTASMTFTSADADAYIWENAGEIDDVLALLRKMRTTPIKVMWM